MTTRVVFRVLLMVLVVLPLGTFRSLYALTRPITGKSIYANGLYGRGSFEGPVARRGDNPSQQSLRFRSWADVTFLRTASPQPYESAGTILEAALLPAVSSGSSRWGVPLFRGASPHFAYCTPSEARIAAGVLVI